jgi:hypothetical protein
MRRRRREHEQADAGDREERRALGTADTAETVRPKPRLLHHFFGRTSTFRVHGLDDRHVVGMAAVTPGSRGRCGGRQVTACRGFAQDLDHGAVTSSAFG